MREWLAWSDVVIAIPTMPQRARMLVELFGQLRACQLAGADIVTRLGTAPREDFAGIIALALATRRPWILHLEDDVWLAPGFAKRALAALRHATTVHGARAVSFFSRRALDVERYQGGTTWRVQAPITLYNIQAIALRSDDLDGLPTWAPSWYAAHPKHVHAADLLLGAWLAQHAIPVWVHLPSLVQHRPGPSTLGRRSRHRQSPTYRLAFGEVPA